MPWVDWWFAYANMSRIILEKSEVNKDRITVVDHAVDVETLSEDLDALTEADHKLLCIELGTKGVVPIKEGNICLYCGVTHPDKKLEFLLEACECIKDDSW